MQPRQSSPPQKYDAGKPFLCITLLRTIATCLITNTHYNQIYPISALAVGGLIGDVLFFVISGFCLANIGDTGFAPWFRKRILRIYPTVWILSLVFLCTGFFRVSPSELISLFLYPTAFHFVGSIVLLYLLFYPVLKIRYLQNHLPAVMLAVAALWVVYYSFLADRSIRLDVAEYPITKFLYFEGMLFGAYVRKHTEKYLGKNRIIKWLWLFASLVLYLLSKLTIDRFGWMDFQFVIFLFLFSIGAAFLVAFLGIEPKLPVRGWFAGLIQWIAPMTLEIYLIQKAIIPHTEKLIFPVNFIVTTLCILLAAWLLKKFVAWVMKLFHM